MPPLVLNAALHLKYAVHPVHAGNCLGYNDNQVCHLYELYQNLGHVIYQGNHLSLGNDTAVRLFRSHPYDGHHGYVYNDIGHRV